MLQITEYKFLKVNFESKVNWRLQMDYLQCNSSFHGQPRYDFLIVKTEHHPIFTKLACIFTCTVANRAYPLALIQPYNAAIPGRRSAKDENLGFLRVRSRPRSASEFIFLKFIVRGALLVEDSETAGDYFAVDAVDMNMFLQLQEF